MTSLADTYFPIKHDSIAPSCKLSTVIDHCFQPPRWQQGIFVADSYIDQAEKEYLAVADFRGVIDKLENPMETFNVKSPYYFIHFHYYLFMETKE